MLLKGGVATPLTPPLDPPLVTHNLSSLDLSFLNASRYCLWFSLPLHSASWILPPSLRPVSFQLCFLIEISFSFLHDINFICSTTIEEQSYWRYSHKNLFSPTPLALGTFVPYSMLFLLHWLSHLSSMILTWITWGLFEPVSNWRKTSLHSSVGSK